MCGRGRGKRRNDETGFEAWGGYMPAKKSKLENQFENMPDKNTEGIFKNIAVFVNGLTNPPASELKEIMHQHGGTFHHYYRSRGARPTTHIIASNLPHAKLKEHQRKLVVRPEWISDSLKADRLLDYRQYLLLPPQNQLLTCLSAASSSKAAAAAAELAVSDSDSASSGEEDAEPTPDDGDAPVSAEAVAAAVGVGAVVSVTSAGRSPVKRAGQPDFLKEFYQKSRLHHISEMKAVFRDYVGRLQDAPDDGHPERAGLLAWRRDHPVPDRDLDSDQDREPDQGADPEEDLLAASDAAVVAHVDMDCFFVSVGLRTRPELRGRPVAVTHSRGGAEPAARAGEDRAAEADAYRARHGGGAGPSWTAAAPHGSMAEIASCSYDARDAGVRNGMFMGAALQLCPGLQTIPYDFDAYREVALALYGTVCGLTRRVQAVSCDELLVDCSALLRETAVTPLQLAAYIRHAVRRETGCPASVGMGPNILLARLATRRAKPDGQFHVTAERAAEFMLEMRVSDLPGVGRATAEQLRRLGADSCGQLQRLELAQLQRELGPRTGRQLHEFCRGRDDRAVTPHAPRRSVSAEVNYGIRFLAAAEMTSFVDELCVELQARMAAASFLADSVTVKVMVRAAAAPAETAKFMGHGVCDTLSRSGRLPAPTDRLETLRREVAALLAALNIPPDEVRGLGLQAGRSAATAARSKAAPPPPPPPPAAAAVVYTAEEAVRLLGGAGPPPAAAAVVYTAEEAVQLLGGAGPPPARPPLPAVPTFCGTAEPGCIRRLVTEWLGSGPRPQPEDVAALSAYLTALVDARLLEPARGLLVLMRRRLGRAAAPAAAPWLAALEQVTEAVQERVLARHGGRLTLPALPRHPAAAETA